MSNLIQAVDFSLTSLTDFEDKKVAHGVLQRLMENEATLRPKRFSAYEPITEVIDASDLAPVMDVWLNSASNTRGGVDMRHGSLLLGCSSGINYQVNWQKSKKPSFSFVGGNAPLSLLKKRSNILRAFFDLAKDLSLLLNSVYGEIRNMSFPGSDLPFDLLKRLPDVPWASVYGPPYVSMFGNERILSAPFHRIEPIHSSHLWLEASESVFDPVPEETRAAIRDHLGKEAFMSKGRWRYTSGTAPSFDFSRVVLR